MSNLNYDEEYGQCPVCTRVFVVSVFGYPTCNYDRSRLESRGHAYPVGAKVGP